jgi:hypothetical protein
VSDATDSNALVPHQLEELFNVNTTVASVGDVLTVTEVDGGEPVWEAATPGTVEPTWYPINLPDGSGSNWTGDVVWTEEGNYLTFVNGDIVQTDVPLTGTGMAIANASRSDIARFVLKLRLNDAMGPGTTPVTMFYNENEQRGMRVAWQVIDDVTYLQTSDHGGTLLAWKEWEPDEDGWATLAMTVPTEAQNSVPFYSMTVDGEYGTGVDPNLYDLRFRVQASQGFDLDLNVSRVEYRFTSI